VTARRRPISRLAVSKKEAAEALGCSVDHLERHVLEHLKVVYSGGRRLIPIVELERYLREQAVPVLPKVELEQRLDASLRQRGSGPSRIKARDRPRGRYSAW
jgi:hypothetical protein